MVVFFHCHLRFQAVIKHATLSFKCSVFLFELCSDGQLYVVILRNQQRSSTTGPVGAEIVLYQLQRLVFNQLLCFSDHAILVKQVRVLRG